MPEVKCPICGKVLKITKPKQTTAQEVIKIHCNKCNVDIEVQVE